MKPWASTRAAKSATRRSPTSSSAPFPDPGAAAGTVVRIIRDYDGYYFITAPGFRHVYIFNGARGKLTLKKKVLIAEQGMEKPFFNRRDLGIELVANGQAHLLNRKGIVSGGKK